MSASVAVLFARRDSFYKSLPQCDVWDIDRDARRYSGSLPVIAHPPCRAWGQLAHFAKPRHDEKALALFAVDQVRRCGGVLEHPAGSRLWPVAGLPEPRYTDKFGGWTYPVLQQWWGHRAYKATRLYIVGAQPADLPLVPFVLGEMTQCVEHMSHAERERTPADFALWLVDLASRCAQGVGAA